MRPQVENNRRLNQGNNTRDRVARGRGAHRDRGPRPSRKKPNWISVLLFLVLVVAPSCSTCREKAIIDAEQYAAEGYQTRVACYMLCLDGLLWGAFVWKSHCQARVRAGDSWLWVGEWGGLHKDPTFRPKGEIFSWTVQGYRDLLTAHGKSVPAQYVGKR